MKCKSSKRNRMVGSFIGKKCRVGVKWEIADVFWQKYSGLRNHKYRSPELLFVR